jgi:uncharacterized membrane protein
VRWILALIGAVIGRVVGDEEGLLGGLFVGGLIGWLGDREQQRLKALDVRRGAASATPQSFEQRATARIIELSQRVEQLEQAVAELRAAPGRASLNDRDMTSASVAASLDPSSLELEGGSAARAASIARARSEADATSQRPPHAPPEQLPRAGTYEQASEPFDPRAHAVAEASAASPDGRVELDEFGWPRAGHDSVSAAPERESADPALPNEVLAATGPSDPQAARRPASWASSVEAAVRSFLFGGNTVVRVGVLVLTIGVGLLVKYAADQAYLPLELRLTLAALIGLALVVVGFTQRAARPSFATALQGGGVAAMYLVTFFAHYAYQLLPGSLTMALLIAIAALSSLLAVLQDAQQLAVYGAIGGFLSPVLASSGGGSHVALFSYYALLNAAISGMALYRSWRLLNWVGFAFTFGVASAWGALRYEPAHMPSASCFLALFFAFYVLDGTLFALRQPIARRGTIDTTLTFGTPLATLALAGGLFRLEHLYLALSCALIAAVYLALASWLRSRREAALAALMQAYIAVGIGVGTMAIPFALDSALATALAWAAEASGLIWVGIKQQRLRTRVGSYVLYAGALCALIAREDQATALGGALFGALIALALALAAALIERHRSALRRAEPIVGHVLLGLALVVWAGACGSAIELLAPEWNVAAGYAALALTTLLLEVVGALASFHAARVVAACCHPVLLASVLLRLPTSGPVFFEFLVVLAGYLVLWLQRRQLATRAGLRDVLHACAAYAVACSIYAYADTVFDDGWLYGALGLLGWTAWILFLATRFPVAASLRGYRAWAAWPVALTCNASLVVAQFAQAKVTLSVPYLPMLSVFDVVQGFWIAALVSSARTPEVDGPITRRIARWGAVLAIFVTLNGMVVRTAQQWAGVPVTPWEIPTAPLVQSAFSILWTLLALLAMVVAHRHKRREVWVAGAVLLAATIVKLFSIDLSRLGGVAKIVTFLAVGVLLLLIGFAAPVPPAGQAREEPS